MHDSADMLSGYTDLEESSLVNGAATEQFPGRPGVCQSDGGPMQKYLAEYLCCPKCHGCLEWNVTDQSDKRITSAEVRCRDCSGAYYVEEGIGVFLTGELDRNDLWKKVDTGLEEYLSQNPEIESKLMDVELDALSPVDQHYRGVIHENRDEMEAALAAYSISREALHSGDTMRTIHDQLDHAVEAISDTDVPVVDLASGECTLVRRILTELHNPVVVTDFSPSVLKRDRTRFIQQGLYDRVSLIAFDARRTPFRTKSIEMLTTFLGLSNIQEPGSLLRELKRIVCGSFVAISCFYSEDDLENGRIIQEAGLADMLYRDRLLELYEESGWQVEVSHSSSALEHASPAGVVLKGAKVDLLPAYDTRLEWCVLTATGS